MEPGRTLLILGGKLKIVEKAKALGLDVVYLQRREQFGPEHRDLVGAAVLLDYTDWAQLRPLAQAAHEAWPCAAAVSLTEPGLDPVARVNDLLGLGGTPYDVSRRFTDKWLMRQHLARAGLAPVAAELVTDRDSLADFGKRHGYPFVVKPTALTASLGVFRVDDPGALDRVWRSVEELRASGALQWADFFTVDQFMMEAFVEGPEYSVEAFSFAGRHVALAVTEKASLHDNFVELGHALPAPLERDAEDAFVRATVEFLDAMGYRDGPSHTELKLGPDGPVVIESHNRVGGDRINELVDAAYGIDLDTYTLGWPFGLVEELTERPRPLQASATRFKLGEPGVVTAVRGVEEVRADPATVVLDVNVRPGDVVPPLRGNWDRLGQVVATGPDSAAAVAACERLLARLEIETRPESTGS